MEQLSYSERVAKTIDQTTENLGETYRQNKECMEAIDLYVEKNYGSKTIKIIKSDVNVQQAFFGNQDFVQDVFGHLVSEHAHLLALMAKKLKKNVEEWERICQDELDNKARDDGLKAYKSASTPNAKVSSAGVWSAVANLPAKQAIETKSPPHVPENRKVVNSEFTEHTIDGLIKRYGERVFLKDGDIGISCVSFLCHLYGIKNRQCNGNCGFRHSLHYDFGTPFQFSFVKSEHNSYFYWFVKKDNPVIFQITLESQRLFCSEKTTNIPLGTLIDVNSAPDDLKRISRKTVLEKYLR